MGRRQIYPLVDMALGGTLQHRLSEARAAGDSFEVIARALSTDGIDVSSETVRKWCAELEVPQAKAAS